MQPATRNVRLDIQLTATETGKPLSLVTLIGWTPATDSVLNQMISQFVSGVQGVMDGSTELVMRTGGTITSGLTLEPFASSGKPE